MEIKRPILEIMTTRGFQEISQSGTIVIYRLKSMAKRTNFLHEIKRAEVPLVAGFAGEAIFSCPNSYQLNMDHPQKMGTIYSGFGPIGPGISRGSIDY